MKTAHFLGLGLVAVGCLMGSNASAQTNFDRDRNTSVRERSRPEYDPIGALLGAFTAYPAVTAGVELNDNIYASSSAVREDTIYTVRPELTIRSNWSRNMLQAFARAGRAMYSDFPKESTTDFQVGANGYVDAGHSRILAGGDYGQYTEPRTSGTAPTSTVKPISYKLGQVNLGLMHTFNRLRLSGRVDVQDYDFDNGRTAAGAVVLQDDRDRTVTAYSARAEYAVSPDTSVFVAAVLDDRKYDLGLPAVSLDRDSKGQDFAVGANFDFSALMRGEFQVGYINQDYDDPTLSSVKGLSTKAIVEWFPSSIQTVTFSATRGVNDATIPGSPGFLAGAYSVQLDHELLRNLILTARAGYGREEYEGVDRDDDRKMAYVGANYLMNRRVGMNLSYDYTKQNSSGANRGQDFTLQRVLVSTTLRF